MTVIGVSGRFTIGITTSVDCLLLMYDWQRGYAYSSWRYKFVAVYERKSRKVAFLNKKHFYNLYKNEVYAYPGRYRVTFEVLTTVAMKVRPTALWNVTPCRMTELTYSFVKSVVYSEDGDRRIIRNVGFYQTRRRLSRCHLFRSVFAVYIHRNNNRPTSYHFRLSLTVI
jgi:hypothetical protein